MEGQEKPSQWPGKLHELKEAQTGLDLRLYSQLEGMNAEDHSAYVLLTKTTRSQIAAKEALSILHDFQKWKTERKLNPGAALPPNVAQIPGYLIVEKRGHSLHSGDIQMLRHENFSGWLIAEMADSNSRTFMQYYLISGLDSLFALDHVDELRAAFQQIQKEYKGGNLRYRQGPGQEYQELLNVFFEHRGIRFPNQPATPQIMERIGNVRARVGLAQTILNPYERNLALRERAFNVTTEATLGNSFNRHAIALEKITRKLSKALELVVPGEEALKVMTAEEVDQVFAVFSSIEDILAPVEKEHPKIILWIRTKYAPFMAKLLRIKETKQAEAKLAPQKGQKVVSGMGVLEDRLRKILYLERQIITLCEQIDQGGTLSDAKLTTLPNALAQFEDNELEIFIESIRRQTNMSVPELQVTAEELSQFSPEELQKFLELINASEKRLHAGIEYQGRQVTLPPYVLEIFMRMYRTAKELIIAGNQGI